MRLWRYWIQSQLIGRLLSRRIARPGSKKEKFYPDARITCSTPYASEARDASGNGYLYL